MEIDEIQIPSFDVLVHRFPVKNEAPGAHRKVPDSLYDILFHRFPVKNDAPGANRKVPVSLYDIFFSQNHCKKRCSRSKS